MDPKAYDSIPGGSWQSTSGSSQSANNPPASLDENSEVKDPNTTIPTSFRTMTVPPEGLPCLNPLSHGDCRVRPRSAAYQAYHRNGKISIWPATNCFAHFSFFAHAFQSRMAVPQQTAGASTGGTPSPFVKTGPTMFNEEELTQEQKDLALTLFDASKGYITESGEFRCEGHHLNFSSMISKGKPIKFIKKRTTGWRNKLRPPQNPCTHPVCANSTFLPPQGDTKQGTVSYGEVLRNLHEDALARRTAKSTVMGFLDDDDEL